MLVSCYLCI